MTTRPRGFIEWTPRRESTELLDAVLSVLAFGKQAEALERHHQGDMLAVMGRLEKSKFTGNDGAERESWSVIVESLHSSRTVRPASRKPAAKRESAGAPFDDPIPWE